MVKAEVLNSPPDILWAKNTYNPSGDMISQVLGVVKIRIGQTLYELKETGDLKSTVISCQVEADPSSTRILIGRLGTSESPPIKVIMSDEKPLSFGNVERINSAVNVAVKLKETLDAYDSVKDIQLVGERFTLSLKSVGLDTSEVWQRIAVMKIDLEANLRDVYPAKFLETADEMDRLGIKEIEMEGGSPGTSEYIRKLFAKKEEAKTP